MGERALREPVLDFGIVSCDYFRAGLQGEGLAMTLLGEDGTDEAGEVKGLGFDLEDFAVIGKIRVGTVEHAEVWQAFDCHA